MHKLTRQNSLKPVFLEKYRKSKKPWQELSKNHHDDHYLPLCQALSKQQKGRCAYCECFVDPLEKGKRHIDHFVRREQQPDLTFEWDNLVLSCVCDACCGRSKDRVENRGKRYLNPYESDGRRLLQFSSIAKQCVACVRPNLSSSDKAIAEDTISAYGLNIPSLCSRRWSRVQSVACDLLEEDFEEIASSDAALAVFKEILEDLISQSKEGEFCSACIDTLAPYMVRAGLCPEDIVL